MNEDEDNENENTNEPAEAPESTGPSDREKALEAELARVRQQNRDLKATKQQPKEEAQPTSGGTESDDNVRALAKQIEDLRTRDERRDIRDGLQLNDDQANAVHGLMQEMPGLKAQEAVTIARARNAELFGASDPAAFDPAVHGTMRPAAGGEPAKTNEQKRADHIKSIAEAPDRLTRDEGFARFIGAHAAAALNLQPGKKG